MPGPGSWLPRIILLPELAAGYGCFWVARRKIAAVKNAGNWVAGLRQTVVADTSWRTDRPRFPVRWLIPALAVIAGTASVGALRYPGLPAHIVTGSGHRVPKSAVSVLVVAGQLYFIAVYSGLMLIVHRSRPDIEAADSAASTLRYRRFLAAIARAPRGCEGHLDAEAAVWPGPDGEGSAVGFDDRLDDGQAEAEPPPVPSSVDAEPLERAEQPLGFRLGYFWAGVGHGEEGAPGPGFRCDRTVV